MKTNHNFLSAFFLLLPFLSLAQGSYKPGYIVTPQGDTVKGSIEYREWEDNPKSINFKGAASSERLTAQKVKFFSVSVGHLAEYEGYAGPISMDNTEINHLSIGKDTSVITDTVFLRVLQDGSKIKLFSYTDGKKRRFFIAPNFSAQPVELSYRVYQNNQDGTGMNTVYERDYKGQLYDEAVKAGAMTPKIKDIISKTDYTDDDLAAVAAAINNISVKDLAKNNTHKLKTAHIVLIVAGVAAILAFVIHDFVAVNHH